MKSAKVNGFLYGNIMAHIGCVQTIESVNLVTKTDSFLIPRMDN